MDDTFFEIKEMEKIANGTVMILRIKADSKDTAVICSFNYIERENKDYKIQYAFCVRRNHYRVILVKDNGVQELIKTLREGFNAVYSRSFQ